MHCFRAFYEAKTRGEFEKKEAPAEKPAYWNNSPKHSESEQGANPFLEMKKDVKKQKEVQVNFVKYPLLTSRNLNFATKKNIFHQGNKCFSPKFLFKTLEQKLILKINWQEF